MKNLINKALISAFYVLILINLTSCVSGKDGNRSRSNIGNENEMVNDSITLLSTIEEHPVVNVYLENSGSMNGYVDGGKTLFQQDVYNYLCDIHISGIPSALNLNFINSKVIKKGSVIENFINKLTPTSFKQSGGSTLTTDMASVFKQVLSLTNDNTVSVFISDCIFSPGKVKSPDAYLANQQVGIKKAVADYLIGHSDLAIHVYQLYSNFDGVYYDYTNHPRHYTGQRPYYIWVMGHTLNISKLLAAIPNERFSGNGVANMWCVYNKTSDNLSYSVVSMAVKGDFNRDSKHAISKIRKGADNKFAFKIAANLSSLELLLGNDYLMDANNYSILMNNQDSEEWYINIERNTIPTMPATHNIILTTEKSISRENLSVVIRCRVPQWAYDLTDTDDTLFSEDNNMKTYGLKYLLDGVQQAYVAKSSGVYAVMDFKLN